MTAQVATDDYEFLYEMPHAKARGGKLGKWEAPTTEGPEELDPLTWEELALALQHRIGLPEDDAERDAGFVMDIFGFKDRVIDNVLEREDRQFFYVLEEEGMLTTDREETTLHDGREWRTHYWALRKKVIKQYADHERLGDDSRRRNGLEDDVYRRLPADAWMGRRF
jgi:hypothetical protein